MATIDADAHVLETPRTWEFMPPNLKRHTPFVVNQQSGETTLAVATLLESFGSLITGFTINNSTWAWTPPRRHAK